MFSPVFPCLCLNLSAPVFLHVCAHVRACVCSGLCHTPPTGTGYKATRGWHFGLDGGCQHWFSRDDFPRPHLTTCHPAAAASVYAHLSARDSHSAPLSM